jgi:hypothetical protein
MRMWCFICHFTSRLMAAAIMLVFIVSLGEAGPAAAQILPQLPNHLLTPDVARTDLTLKKICTTKWGRDARHVTATMKKQVFTAYGLTGNTDPACIPDARGRHCEIDHLLSRELVGADEVRNLWPQPYGSQPWNAVRKDCVETRLHKEICAKNPAMTLKQAQDAIRSDWTAVYLRFYDPPVAGKPCTAKAN